VLPVTDDRGYMLGIITVDDVLDIVEQRATEDTEARRIRGAGASYSTCGSPPCCASAALAGGAVSREMLTATAMAIRSGVARAVWLALLCR